MAQTGYTPILIYSSSTGGNAPAAGNLTNSTLGSETAINITDGKLFYKDNAGSVQVIGWKTAPTTAGGTGLTSYTAGDLLYYASGTTLSKLAIGASTTILTSSGTAPQWSAASGITVGTATNIAGGAAGSVPYQTGAGATSLLAIGTAYYQLGVNAGGTAPAWQPSATSVLTAQGDLLYASAANTLTRLAKNTTASRYLSNSGTSNNPAWAQIDLTNGVTGTLPTTNGGTGLTSFTANAILYSSSTSALATSANWGYNGTDVTLTGGNYLVSAGKGLAWLGNSATYMTPEDNVQGARIAAGGSFKLLVNGGSEALDVNATTRNITWTGGNLVQATASKGINFTANSAAAGMTSQLLNWYEEGTWTPVASGTWSTTPTIYGTARYTRVGRQVTLTFGFQNGALTTNTNGYFTGLPFTPADIGTGAVVDNNIVNRGLCEATGAGRIWVTNTSFPDVNYVTVTYFV